MQNTYKIQMKKERVLCKIKKMQRESIEKYKNI